MTYSMVPPANANANGKIALATDTAVKPIIVPTISIKPVKLAIKKTRHLCTYSMAKTRKNATCV